MTCEVIASMVAAKGPRPQATCRGLRHRQNHPKVDRTRLTGIARRSSSAAIGRMRRRVKVWKRQLPPCRLRRTTVRLARSTEARSDQAAVHNTADGVLGTNDRSIRFRWRDRRSTVMPDSQAVRRASGHVAVRVPTVARHDAAPTMRTVTMSPPVAPTARHRCPRRGY